MTASKCESWHLAPRDFSWANRSPCQPIDVASTHSDLFAQQQPQMPTMPTGGWPLVDAGWGAQQPLQPQYTSYNVSHSLFLVSCLLPVSARGGLMQMRVGGFSRSCSSSSSSR
jgi:hypothetical protein